MTYSPDYPFRTHRCITCGCVVADLPGLDPSRPTCSTRCKRQARADALRRLLREMTR